MQPSKNSNTPAKSSKPAKPYEGFPLYAHATGRWAKKIRGKIHFFGPWRDWNEALKKFQEQRDDLYAGRKPRESGTGVTVSELCNRFLAAKKTRVLSGELGQRSWDDYFSSCERVTRYFGKSRAVEDLRSDDFEGLRASIAKTRGPVSLGTEIQRIRTLFHFAYASELIEKPVRFGNSFSKPKPKVIREARQARGELLFSAAEIQSMLKKAAPSLKAMILLAINCGFGNRDVGMLPAKALDLRGGWVNFPRPKTAIPRRCPLWQETIEAIRAAVKLRPEPKRDEDADLLFVTKYGQGWAKSTSDNPVAKETKKLLIELKIARPRHGFYTLRHVFETIAGETRDQVAVNSIMGHVDGSMAAAYRERISDERLLAVTDYVHSWLYPPKRKKEPASKEQAKRSAAKSKNNG